LPDLGLATQRNSGWWRIDVRELDVGRLPLRVQLPVEFGDRVGSPAVPCWIWTPIETVPALIPDGRIPGEGIARKC